MLEEILTGILGVAFLVGAFQQFQCRGPIWSAEYFAASPKERRKLCTRKGYHFSAAACLTIGLSLVFLMIYSLTDLKLFLYVVFLLSALLFLLLIYGAARVVRQSTLRDEEENRRKRRRS